MFDEKLIKHNNRNTYPKLLLGRPNQKQLHHVAGQDPTNLADKRTNTQCISINEI